MRTVNPVPLDTPEQIDAEVTMLALGSPGLTVAGERGRVEVFRERRLPHVAVTDHALYGWLLVVHQPDCEPRTVGMEGDDRCIWAILRGGPRCLERYYDSPRRAVQVAARIARMLGADR